MSKKIVLITGGAKGIGLATANRLSSEEMTVVINTHTPLEEKESEKLEEQGIVFKGFEGDVSNEDDAQRIIKTVIDEYGRIDVLVNNAGIIKDKLLFRMGLDDFETVLKVNLVGTFNMTKLVMKFMQKQKSGNIINISSISGLHGNIGQGNYSASKAGIVGLTKTTAKEGAIRGIRCNAVAPGMINTDMVHKMNAQRQNEFIAQIPLGRFGRPEEIADTISFLIKNNYITGQVITVDGGLTI
ncbi:3-oxoacyl-ACP reductase family protein [Companilactobacillus nuruki]|uniref:Beta-ketoacyl-ACP reductase n=1 Tax=Companilactobacillus nuruki TaxID=1993540 RepID=A0A2N7AWA5_9LACO|nr:3-oxoacyl-ACP reductase family protein [Companilactobacillus nuruki]PMD73035.1 beta-ketoacyl-ACP reductase [Companilactobacillus nuruki]